MTLSLSLFYRSFLDNDLLFKKCCMLGVLYLLPVLFSIVFKVDDILSNLLMKKLTQSLTLIPRPAGRWQSWGWDKDVSSPRPLPFHHCMYVE